MASDSGWRISKGAPIPKVKGAYLHEILDPAGKRAGYIQLRSRKGSLHIYNIWSFKGPHSIGYRGVRDLSRQIRTSYGGAAVTFSGTRVSGTRMKARSRKRKTSVRFSGQDASILGRHGNFVKSWMR